MVNVNHNHHSHTAPFGRSFLAGANAGVHSWGAHRPPAPHDTQDHTKNVSAALLRRAAPPGRLRRQVVPNQAFRREGGKPAARSSFGKLRLAD